MNADSSDQDLKALWQDQPPETDPMTLEHVQTVGRKLDRRVQRTIVIGGAVAVFLAFNAGQMWQRTADPLARVALALLAVGAVGYLILIYRLTHLARDPTEPAGMFLRRRLAQGLRPGRALLLVSPLLPGMLLEVAVAVRTMLHNPQLRHLTAAQWALNALPLLILAGAWIVAFFILAPRARRRIRERIAELDALLKK